MCEEGGCKIPKNIEQKDQLQIPTDLLSRRHLDGKEDEKKETGTMTPSTVPESSKAKIYLNMLKIKREKERKHREREMYRPDS